MADAATPPGDDLPPPPNRRRAAVGFWLLVSLVAAVGAGKAVLNDTFDPDLFWHLRVAEQLRADGIGPIVDRLSFASVREPWSPYSWLAELGMLWTWSHLGWRGAVAIAAVMNVLVIVLIALCANQLAGNDRRLNAAIATAVGTCLALPFLSFRPVTIAVILLGVIAWLLLRDRRVRSQTVWIVIPITALLANVHLAVIVVPIWVGCLLVGGIIERRDVRRYAILTAATSLACLATPMLPGAVRTAWYYQSADVMVEQSTHGRDPIIKEMQPVWRGYAGTFNAVLLLVLAACVTANHRKLRAGEWLWLLAGLAMMARLGKFAPVFAFIAAGAMAVTMPRLRDRVMTRTPVLAALGIALALCLWRVAAGFPWSGTMMDQWANRRGPDVLGYPASAAGYVEANVEPRMGRLITEFNWGGYVAWRLGDRYQVLLDGRTQLYTPAFWRSTYLGINADAANALRGTNADAAIIPIRGSRFRTALGTLGWRSVHRDDFAEVLLPPP